MRRKALDIILTAGGSLVTLVLVATGALLLWGYSYANSTVHDQLASQQIYFPAAGSSALADPKIGPYVDKYAGQQVVDGPQALAYADHFILVHINKASNGLTYSQISAKAQANPTDAALKGTVQTVFQGTALRGMLLNAYAFWMVGQVAMWAGIGALTAAGVMLILVALGIWHTRRVPATAEAFAGRRGMIQARS